MFLLPRKRRALSGSSSVGTPHSQTNTLDSAAVNDSSQSPPRSQIEGLATPLSFRSSFTPIRTPFSTPPSLQTPAPASLRLTAHPVFNLSQESVASAGKAAAGAARCKKTFPCRVCGYVLATSYNRLRHERSKHAGPVTESMESDPAPPQPQLSAAAGVKRSAARAFEEGEATPGGPAAASSSDGEGVTQPGFYAPSQVATELQFQGFEIDPEAYVSTSSDSASDQEAGDLADSGPTGMELDMGEPAAAAASATPLEAAQGAEIAVTDATGAETAPAFEIPTYEPAPLLQDTQLQSACLPFLQWMCQPPITQVEALIKARRVKVITQLQPIKLNLRFIFGLLLDGKVIAALELQVLTRLAVCQALGAALEKREVGSGRIHAIFLLVKKVLVYLSSCESTQRRQFISPATHESYMYVESICSDSSHRRKQEARNRAMLGVQTSKLLHQSQPTRGLPALPANAFAMPSLQGNIEMVTSKPVSPPPSSPPARIIPSAADLEPSSNELTGEELKVVACGSLAYLKLREPAYYVHHLVTATLCLGLAPRSQVLKQLRIGSSFVKEADGRYWVKMLAELNKNGKPTVFALPLQLTEPFDHYFDSVRPALLQQSGQEHDYVFFKKNGTAPRTDFSELTALATQQLIHRPVNAHAFRSAVITAFYETGATQGDMDVLANIMAHDSATARAYYFKPQMAKAAVDTNERMLRVLDMPSSGAEVDTSIDQLTQ